MEILRKGTPPSERSYMGTCTSCNTCVRFKQHEATSSRDQRDPGYHVMCPVCKGTIWGKQEVSTVDPY